MPELAFHFGYNCDAPERFLSVLEHTFAASPKEGLLHNGGTIRMGILTKNHRDAVHAGDIWERYAMYAKCRYLLESGGARLDELGSLVITVERDDNERRSFDQAFCKLSRALSTWTYFTDTVVTYSIHRTQSDGQHGFQPAHMHVLWSRRSGRKLYEDSVLPWYLHGQFGAGESEDKVCCALSGAPKNAGIREMYVVGRKDGRKVIHFVGRIWFDGRRYHLEEALFCGLGGRGTPVSYIDEIRGSKRKWMMNCLEQVSRLECVLSEKERDDYVESWGGSCLHLDNVTEYTPCGSYWFDVG